MAHKAIVRMLKSLSRRTVENRIGGEWCVVPEAPERRTNGRFVTYTGPSIIKQERKDCFCQGLWEGAVLFTGRSWTEVFKAMEVHVKQNSTA